MYIHLYTGSLIQNYIYGRSLSGDPLSIIMPFHVTSAYASVNQHTSRLNFGWQVCLSVLIWFRFQHIKSYQESKIARLTSFDAFGK